MKTVILDNTGFNVKYWGRYSLLDFIRETMKDGFYKNHTYEKRIELLTVAHRLIIAVYDIT